jgi:hypothetical protein
VRCEIDMSESCYHANDFDISVAGRDEPSRLVEL